MHQILYIELLSCSAFESSLEALQQPTIRVVAVIAEGVPEADTKKLIAYAREHNKILLGPATVGGIQVYFHHLRLSALRRIAVQSMFISNACAKANSCESIYKWQSFRHPYFIFKTQITSLWFLKDKCHGSRSTGFLYQTPQDEFKCWQCCCRQEHSGLETQQAPLTTLCLASCTDQGL